MARQMARLVVGAVVATSAVLGALALKDRLTQQYDAAEAERRARRPGDEILPRAQVHNDHGATLDAAPEVIWSRLLEICDLPVSLIEPERHLVAVIQGRRPSFDMTWGFYLSPLDGLDGLPKTRLNVRERYSATNRRRLEVLAVVNTLVTWRILRRLGRSAPGSAQG